MRAHCCYTMHHNELHLAEITKTTLACINPPIKINERLNKLSTTYSIQINSPKYSGSHFTGLIYYTTNVLTHHCTSCLWSTVAATHKHHPQCWYYQLLTCNSVIKNTWFSFLNSTTWKKMCSRICLASCFSFGSLLVTPRISPHFRT